MTELRNFGDMQNVILIRKTLRDKYLFMHSLQTSYSLETLIFAFEISFSLKTEKKRFTHAKPFANATTFSAGGSLHRVQHS